MDRNNKEERIAIEEARELVHQAIQKITSPDYPLVYVGDSFETYRGNYLIPACPYNKDENPQNNCIRVFVDSMTGETSLAFDLTG